jgi:hypothetical protein
MDENARTRVKPHSAAAAGSDGEVKPGEFIIDHPTLINLGFDVEKRARRITGTGGKDKTAVMGILERGGKVRATVIANRKKKSLQAEQSALIIS